jgi:hypothetical protein
MKIPMAIMQEPWEVLKGYQIKILSLTGEAFK